MGNTISNIMGTKSNEEIIPSALKKNGKISFVFEDGSAYDGEWLDDKRHGQGIMTFGESRYEGIWENDKRHGKGVHTYSNGDKYEGQWENDEKSGDGIYTWKNGGSYSGEWKNNAKEGDGIRTLMDGSKYSGRWIYNKLTSKSTIVNAPKTKKINIKASKTKMNPGKKTSKKTSKETSKETSNS